MRDYRFAIVVEKDKQGYFAYCPELQGCYTQGETFEDVVRRFPYFLEEVYNKKRLHLAFGYLPSSDFEELVLNQENNGLTRQTLLTLPVQLWGCSPFCPIKY